MLPNISDPDSILMDATAWLSTPSGMKRRASRSSSVSWTLSSASPAVLAGAIGWVVVFQPLVGLPLSETDEDG